MDWQRLSAFINSFDTDHDPFLCAIEQEAIRKGVPVIRHEMINFLHVLLELKKPGRILEIGTATGFSALVMASFTDPSCTITTLEQDALRCNEARAHFAKSGMQERICLIEGDALEVLGKMKEEVFDFVFLDAAKGQYTAFLPLLKERMTPGAVLVSDNVLQEGDLLESHFLVERRNRTIYKRMREYLYLLQQDEAFVTSIVPIGDGVTVSIKRTGEGR